MKWVALIVGTLLLAGALHARDSTPMSLGPSYWVRTPDNTEWDCQQLEERMNKLERENWKERNATKVDFSTIPGIIQE